jgi:hypothetical protein
MTDVTVIGNADLAGKRLAFGLAEDRIGHYPEFRDFFIRIFGLDHKGLAEPGFACAPSGIVYTLVFIGRSGEPFPSGVEINASSMPLNRSIATRWTGTFGPFCDG